MWETGLVYPMSQFWLTIDPSFGFGNTSTRAKLNHGIRPGKITCNGVAVARQFSLSFSIFLSLSFFFGASCSSNSKRHVARNIKETRREERRINRKRVGPRTKGTKTRSSPRSSPVPGGKQRAQTLPPLQPK